MGIDPEVSLSPRGLEVVKIRLSDLGGKVFQRKSEEYRGAYGDSVNGRVPGLRTGSEERTMD